MALNKELVAKIDAYLAEHKDDIVKDLMDLARIPSIRTEGTEGAPYGQECLNALNAASDLFKKNGFKSAVYGGRYGVAECGEGEKSIGIFGHCDVVPVSEGWVVTEPFEPVVKDGILVGRGVCDNKAGVIASLYIPIMFRDLGIKLNSKLVCYMGGAEETGMDDLDCFNKEQPMPDLNFVPDGTFPVSYGEKGICRFWTEAPKPLEKIVEFSGGNAFNIVLDDVLVKFVDDEELFNEVSAKAAGRSEFKIEKCDGGFTLRARGSSKHAAEPEGSVNATWLVTNLLKDIKALPESDREVISYAEYILDGSYGVHLNIADNDPVFTKLTCVNGMVALNEGKMRLSYDIRYGTATDGKKMVETLEKTLGENGWKFELNELDDGFLLERENNKFLDKIVEIFRELSGDDKAEPFLMSGGTYSRRLKNSYSIGDNVRYGRTKLDLPAGHGSAHQCDECICIKTYLEAMKILALNIIECDKLL